MILTTKQLAPFCAQCEGAWRFSYIMDYELRLKVVGEQLHVELYDLTCDEECELVWVSTTLCYVTLAMDSSWGKLALQLMPDAGGEVLCVDVHDVDYFVRGEEQGRLEEGNAVILTAQQSVFPEWIDGWWRQGAQGIYIERVKPDTIRFAMFWLDDEEREYLEFADLFSAEESGLYFSVCTERPYMQNVENRLFFNTENQELMLHFHVLLKAEKAPAGAGA